MFGVDKKSISKFEDSLFTVTIIELMTTSAMTDLGGLNEKILRGNERNVLIRQKQQK